jgi:glycine cleavage system H lipoate-binding protein
MVFVLVFLTVVFFITMDFFVKKKEKMIEEHEKRPKSPIFMSPEKALKPLGYPERRLFHRSHSWALPKENGGYYIGYDKFIPFIFADDVNVDSIPAIGTQIHQGEKIWDVRLNNRKVTQLSPISGEITDINPAFGIGVPLPSDEIEASWIIKVKPSGNQIEINNLLSSDQANIVNTALRDVISRDFHGTDFLNDGGQINPSFITNMKDEDWENFSRKFFPVKIE